MFNIGLIFGAHMVTDKQFPLKISQSYKHRTETDKRSQEVDRRFKVFIYLAVIATQTQTTPHCSQQPHCRELVAELSAGYPT